MPLARRRAASVVLLRAAAPVTALVGATDLGHSGMVGVDPVSLAAAEIGLAATYLEHITNDLREEGIQAEILTPSGRPADAILN